MRDGHVAVRARRQCGVTMVECCVATTVAVALIGTALPSFQQAIARRHLEGMAAQVVTDVMHARSEAVARSETVRMSFSTAYGASCYIVHTGGRDDCACGADGTATCAAGAQLIKSVYVAANQGLQVHANVASMVFDPTYGTTSPAGTVRVVSDDGRALHQAVNLLGRPRSCSPAPGLSGYPIC